MIISKDDSYIVIDHFQKNFNRSLTYKINPGAFCLRKNMIAHKRTYFCNSCDAKRIFCAIIYLTFFSNKMETKIINCLLIMIRNGLLQS